MNTTQSKFQRVYDYASPYTSHVWEMASGHAWDRLAAIAGEYERGERDWASVVLLVLDTENEILAHDHDTCCGALSE